MSEGIPAGRNPYNWPVKHCTKCEKDTVQVPSLHGNYYLCGVCGKQ